MLLSDPNPAAKPAQQREERLENYTKDDAHALRVFGPRYVKAALTQITCSPSLLWFSK